MHPIVFICSHSILPINFIMRLDSSIKMSSSCRLYIRSKNSFAIFCITYAKNMTGGIMITLCHYFLFATKTICSCTYYMHQTIKIENHLSHLFRFSTDKKNEFIYWQLLFDGMPNMRNDSRFRAFWHFKSIFFSSWKYVGRWKSIACGSILIFDALFSPNKYILPQNHRIHKNWSLNNLTRMIKEKCSRAHRKDEMCR